MDLKLTTRTRDDGTAVVSAVGDIDCYTSARLRQALRDVTGRYLIILDLSGCEFLDQYGLGVIVGALRQCRVHDGSLAAAWARANFMSDGKWSGDICGCPDSGRCANGFHHYGEDDCGCLPVLLEQFLAGEGCFATESTDG